MTFLVDLRNRAHLTFVLILRPTAYINIITFYPLRQHSPTPTGAVPDTFLLLTWYNLKRSLNNLTSMQLITSIIIHFLFKLLKKFQV